MAASAGSIFVDLLLNDSKYTQGWNRARNTTSRSSSVITSAIARIGAVAGTALSVQQIIQYSDTFKQLESRLSLVVSDTTKLSGVQQQLFDIAQRTRQPLEGVYNLYTRISQALPEQARASYDLLGVTESINQALAITGEGSAQAASAILQFTQAVASGFQGSGQEINALLDSAPRLAQALQRSFGDGQKSLKELSKEGALDLDVILKALSGTGEEGRKLREEFAKLPPTVGQALTQVNNSFLTLVGTSDLVRQGTDLIVLGLQEVSKFIDILAKDTNILETAFTGLLVKAIELYETWNEIAARNAQRTNLFGLRDEDVAEYEQNAEKARKAIERIRAEYNKNRGIDPNAPANNNAPQSFPGAAFPKAADGKEAEKRQKELNQLLERNREIITGLDSASLKYEDTIRDLDKLLQAGAISQAQYNDALFRAFDEFEKAGEAAKKFGVDTEQFAKRAAENIQDAFADFLFDPFQDGLKGMAKGFIDTVRRMIAEAQAAKLAKALFGELAGGEGDGLLGGALSGIGKAVEGGLGKLFAGAFATGGFIPPGQFGVVGEGGGMQHAELVMGGRSGATVIPQSKLGGGGNTYVIDARGTDASVIRRVEQTVLALAGPGVIEQRVNNASARGGI